MIVITKYRPKSSYVSKDPEKRARSLANLKRGKKPGTLQLIKYDKKKLQDINIIEFATGKDFLNLSFKERPAQEVILRVLYGLPLNEDQKAIFKILTKNKGGTYIPGQIRNEACLALGARSGKSLIASIIALYEATRQKWARYLNRGESGYVVVVSTRQKQSEAIIGANCLRLMQNSPILKGYIKDSTMSELTLKNNMKIVSSPCTSYSYRGVPIFCLVCDEIGHFFVEGPKADSEILNALIPRMSQFPGAKLILISTPSAKQGSLWIYYEEGFKVPGRLTAQAESLFMNPLVDRKFLAKEKKRDIDNWNREYLAQFAEQVEAFLSYELVENSLKLAGDLAYNSKYQYFAGIDASGLSGRDKFALSVTHKKDNDIYCDKVVTWDLKDPDPIMKDIKKIAEMYRFNRVSIDRYAKGWVESALKKLGLEVVIRPTLAEVYINLKSLMIGDRLFLPDNKELKKALLNTQAYYGRNNALSIAHERIDNSHADDADSIATAVFEATGEEQGSPQVRWIGRGTGTDEKMTVEEARKEARRRWIEGDDDFDNELPPGNIGIGRNRFIGGA